MQAKRASRQRKPGKPTLPKDEAERVRAGVLKLLDRFEDNKTALAEALHVSQPTVTAWSQGDSVPAGPNLEAIARLLGMSEFELRKGVRAVAEGSPAALDVALLYWPGRWSDQAIERARALSTKGESHSAQGWTVRLDELQLTVSRR